VKLNEKSNAFACGGCGEGTGGGVIRTPEVSNVPVPSCSKVAIPWKVLELLKAVAASIGIKFPLNPD